MSDTQNPGKKLPIELRPGTPEDANFILNSWLKSYRQSAFAKNITNTVYFEGHHKVIRTLIKKSECWVACDVKDPIQIFGYLVAEKVDNIPVIHYAYVKQMFRNMGIGKMLLAKVKTESEPGVFTHHTRQGERMAPKHLLIHHPYLAFDQPEKEEK